MSGDKKSKVKWRAKFPRTKREEFLQYWGSQRRLQAADAENSRQGLVKYASCDPDLLQPYPLPSVTGSVTAISLDQAPRGHRPRWKKEGYFGGEQDTPLAANEESWSEMRTYATDPSVPSRRVGEHVADGSPSRRDTSISSIESPPLLSISQVGLNGYNYGPVTPYSEKSFAYHPDNDEVFAEQSPDPNRSRLYFNNVAQYLSYDPARLDPIREGDEYLLREAVHSEQNERASDFDILCYLLGIIFYLANVGSDIALALKYFTAEQYVFFALTVCFVALPAILMTLFSAVLYYQDHQIIGKKTSAVNWLWRIIIHMFLLAPLIRLIETLKFGLKSRQDEGWRENRKNYKFMLDEDVDLTLIRLFENFLEDAPQLTLQLYIMSAHGTENDFLLSTLQFIGVITSWTSLAWSYVSFATALRNSNPGKAKMRVSSKIAVFLWRFFTIGARMIALALFATAFGFWATLALVGGHLLVMIFWMLLQNSVYCSVEIKDEDGNVKVEEHPCKEHCFRVMAAFTLVFSFFNISEGRTRLRSLVYYTVVFAENMVMIIAWYVTASTKTNAWYHTPAIVMVIFGFFLGILFQILYYKCCHPIYYSKEHEHMTIPLWVSCDELSLVGPNSKTQPNEVVSESEPLSKGQRTPIYNPPSRASSVADQTSMAGLRRLDDDDTCDISDSLIYRPNSTKRNEVPKVEIRGQGTQNEEGVSDHTRTPPRIRAGERFEPPREALEERVHHQRPTPAKKPSKPAVEEITPPTVQHVTPPYVSDTPERRTQERSPAPHSPQEAKLRSSGRSPRIPRGTPPPIAASSENSSPTRSPASTSRGTESEQRSEDILSSAETLQDVSYKMTTV